jgi:copper chaperone CopZ
VLILLRLIFSFNPNEHTDMTKELILSVQGMKCGGCETLLTQALLKVAGISQVLASATEQSVSIQYDTETAPLALLETAITNAGFTVSK